MAECVDDAMKDRLKTKRKVGTDLCSGSEQALPIQVLQMWKKSGRQIFLQVATGSMRPMIRPGDSVTIRMGRGNGLKSGDIVAYVQNNRILVHRLVKIEFREGHRRFWQQGDALSGWGCFEEEAFVGKVAFIHRGTRVLDMDRSFWGFLNRFLGLAGRMRIEALVAARRVRQTWR